MHAAHVTIKTREVRRGNKINRQFMKVHVGATLPVKFIERGTGFGLVYINTKPKPTLAPAC